MMDVYELLRKEGLRRGLSGKTIKTYRECLVKFFRFSKVDPRKVKNRDVDDYLDFLLARGSTGSTLNVNLCALKYLYSILNRKLLFYRKYSRKPRRMPTFLTRGEVKRLLDSIKNPTHNLMISLMYSSGLRLSELVNLRKKDIELERNCGWVRNGKGGKDRPFIIAHRIKSLLEEHVKDISFDSFVFLGRNHHISPSSVQKIISDAAMRAGIMKRVHPHTLRHSFSTHLIESGYGLSVVQDLLGHSSPDTTMIYVHMARPVIEVQSPLDAL
jgi:site-specific recombinase XerD